MSLDEVIWMIKRNKHTKKDAIMYISDFLNIDKKSAEKIYFNEFGVK